MPKRMAEEEDPRPCLLLQVSHVLPVTSGLGTGSFRLRCCCFLQLPAANNTKQMSANLLQLPLLCHASHRQHVTGITQCKT